jgi:LemA protein
MEILIGLMCFLAIVVVLVIWVFGTYNSLVGKRNEADRAYSDMDVSLKKRFDLVPNLVETVKGLAKQESAVFDKITTARSAVAGATSPEQRLNAEAGLSSALRGLFALVESNPQLVSAPAFQDLNTQLSSIEGDIQSSRRYYNGAVLQFNNSIQMIPSNIIAGMFGFKVKPLFEIEEGERTAPKVQF